MFMSEGKTCHLMKEPKVPTYSGRVTIDEELGSSLKLKNIFSAIYNQWLH